MACLCVVAAALSAQFSAAIDDTSGAGGLVDELTAHRIKPHYASVLLVGAWLALTWTADVFAIIGYASRAFAIYYALQAAIAAVSSIGARRIARAVLSIALSVLGVAIAVFGTSVEG